MPAPAREGEVDSLAASTTDTTERPRPGAWPWWIAVLAIAAAAAAWQWGGRGPADERGPRATTAAAVETVAIAREDLPLRLRYPGELFADAVDVGSRIPGHVASVAVRLGDRVEAEQELAHLDDAVIRRRIREIKAEVRAQQAVIDSSETAEHAARRDVERTQGLLAREAASQQELDDVQTGLDQRRAERAAAVARLEQARASLAVLDEDVADAIVRAPFAGIVARRDVDPGAFVSVGAPIVRIVAAEPLRVRFRVPEHEIESIATDLPLLVHTHGGVRPRAGTLTRAAGEVSPGDRTLLVEGIVDETEGLRPGMYADVELEFETLRHAQVVPEGAVMERVDASGRTSQGVFVLQEGAARWTAVRLRGRAPGRVAIAAADGAELPEDTQVLVRGHRELADGSPVEVVERVEAGS